MCSVADPLVVEAVSFQAGPYRLRGELAYGEAAATAGAAVLAGPHPLLGGNMHNNVVRGLGDGLAERGFVTLRFNYRGVGQSQGPPVDVAAHLAQFWKTSHVPDEMELRHDVQAATNFLHQAAGPVPCLALIGYSFGCALLPFIHVEAKAPRVLIAPTIGKHDYQSFQACTSPTLVIASEDDFATDADGLRQWFDRLAAPKRLVQARLDNHFFRGHEAWLVETVWQFLEEQR